MTIVYSERGERSVEASRILSKRGFKVSPIQKTFEAVVKEKSLCLSGA